jgi:hypothetical protein
MVVCHTCLLQYVFMLTPTYCDRGTAGCREACELSATIARNRWCSVSEDEEEVGTEDDSWEDDDEDDEDDASP